MKNETTNRNTIPALRPILALTQAALCLSLVSCVAPYDDGYYLRNDGGYVVTEAPRQSRYYTEYTNYR